MDDTTHLSRAHLRIARPSRDLEAVTRFYRDGLGFEVIGAFQEHDGFDGVMLGHAGAAYHLEFTHRRDRGVAPASTDEDLLVFYLPIPAEWEAAVARMERLGHRPVAAGNPYWERAGKVYEDPDGYRVVLHRFPWPVE